MKFVKRLIILALLVLAFIAGITYHEGRQAYEEAISAVLGRAVFNNIKAGEVREGGSTITQQLARIAYFEQDTKLSRKLAEVFVAREIEKNYDKEEIFELYVNAIYFGSGYYGIYDASRGYYGKDPWQLSDYEATMLAGVPNAPSVYSPDVNPDLAEQRRQQVIACMVEEGYIEEGEI